LKETEKAKGFGFASTIIIPNLEEIMGGPFWVVCNYHLRSIENTAENP